MKKKVKILDKLSKMPRSIIFGEVMFSPELTSTEKLILTSIIMLQEDEAECFVTNKYFATLYGITTVQVSRIITDLVHKGLITRRFSYTQSNVTRRHMGVRAAIILKLREKSMELLEKAKKANATYSEDWAEDIDMESEDFKNMTEDEQYDYLVAKVQAGEENKGGTEKIQSLSDFNMNVNASLTSASSTFYANEKTPKPACDAIIATYPAKDKDNSLFTYASAAEGGVDEVKRNIACGETPLCSAEAAFGGKSDDSNSMPNVNQDAGLPCNVKQPLTSDGDAAADHVNVNAPLHENVKPSFKRKVLNGNGTSSSRDRLSRAINPGPNHPLRDQAMELIQEWHMADLCQISQRYMEKTIQMLIQLMDGSFYADKPDYAKTKHDRIYLKDEISRAIHHRHLSCHDENYFPTDPNAKKTMKKVPMFIWLYNDKVANGHKSKFLNSLEPPIANSATSPLPDEHPKLTQCIKREFINQVLQGFVPKKWSVYEENHFIRASMMLKQFHKTLLQKGNGAYALSGLRDPDWARRLVQCVIDDVGDHQLERINTSWLCTPRTFNQRLPKSFGIHVSFGGRE